ncbi:MAG: hypothetical protein JSS75_00450 [Bacteroidetes bacterium]|nr:hypothetical protein [Bacteroidota bacterium]
MSTSDRIILVAINSGGSHTEMCISFSGGKQTRYERSGSWKYTDIGIERSVSNMLQLIFDAASPDVYDVLRVVISMSGASDEIRNREFETEFTHRSPFRQTHIHLEGDSLFSLRAAYGSHGSGFLMIAGTGSVVVAADRTGRVVKRGGWGRMLGDDGSGYWLGLESLRHYTKAIDGAERTGRLFELVREQIRSLVGSDFADLRLALYSGKVSPAQFGRLIFEAGDDPAADEILRNGAKHLVDLVRLIERETGGSIDRIVTRHGSVACSPIYSAAIARELGDGFELRTLHTDDVLGFALTEAAQLGR